MTWKPTIVSCSIHIYTHSPARCLCPTKVKRAFLHPSHEPLSLSTLLNDAEGRGHEFRTEHPCFVMIYLIAVVSGFGRGIHSFSEGTSQENVDPLEGFVNMTMTRWSAEIKKKGIHIYQIRSTHEY